MFGQQWAAMPTSSESPLHPYPTVLAGHSLGTSEDLGGAAPPISQSPLRICNPSIGEGDWLHRGHTLGIGGGVRQEGDYGCCVQLSSSLWEAGMHSWFGVEVSCTFPVPLVELLYWAFYRGHGVL